jgi:hypothetical protein
MSFKFPDGLFDIPPVATHKAVDFDVFLQKGWLGGRVLMEKVGRNCRRWTICRFYDRALSRILYFEDEVIPPPLTIEPETYGNPTPLATFRDSKSPETTLSPSNWIYPNESPALGAIGLIPSAHQREAKGIMAGGPPAPVTSDTAKPADSTMGTVSIYYICLHSLCL